MLDKINLCQQGDWAVNKLLLDIYFIKEKI